MSSPPDRAQRLELTWVNKDVRPRLEPRILREDPALSYHAPHRVTATDRFDNLLIQGDNLLALKSLITENQVVGGGGIKCIFIDPPYNTGSAFTHYPDGLEHSVWLSMMRDRLELMRQLLAPDGSLWITLDDNEHAYCKVMCDEVFGRGNFVANVVWQKVFAPKGTAKHFSVDQDYVLVYAKNAEAWRPNLMPRSEKQDKAYKNPDNDSRGPWTSGDVSARNYYSAGSYSIITPTGRVIDGPPKGTYWRFSEARFKELDADNRIWWGTKKDNQPRLKRFLSDVMAGIVPQTIWLHTEVGNTQEAKKEANAFAIDGTDVFDTPKPERLIHRILTLATNPGDLVLDSFLGSGTTAAVAHKMGRRWIGVELGDHAVTHVVPRLRKVIDGQDPGGVTKETGWTGGGGFRFYRLAPSLLLPDRWGNLVINPAYDAPMLAEALCKLEGFTYAPSETAYWQHGRSSETDFVYVTTATLTQGQLQQLAEDVGPARTLLVLCAAFRGTADPFPNLTVKRIPRQVLSRCEWNHDDYSLEIKNLPQRPAPAPPKGQYGLAFDADPTAENTPSAPTAR